MTTPTSAANATGLPDRRHFLSTFAAAGAFSFVTVPALADARGPIEAMWPEHLRLEAEYDAACERTWDAEEKYEEPERPRWHPVHEEGGYVALPTRPGYGTFVLDDRAANIAYLKDVIAREYEPDQPDSGRRNKVCARRSRKTLAKIEAWQAEVRRRKHRAGLTKATAAEANARSLAHASRDAIFAIEATTFRELAFQAAIVERTWQEGRVERVVERLVELAGVTSSPLGRA